MSLVGFKAQNHPQQTAKPMVDDRGTTPEVFDPLNERFNFTIDVAASAENAKCARYCTVDISGLAKSWADERVWCNPPYSSIEPWLQKAWEEWNWWKGGYGPQVIVMLLPANRTEQGWWQRQVEPALRERHEDFRVEFIAGRLRFLAPGALEIKPNERPPFGCCLLIWQKPSPHVSSTASVQKGSS